MKRQNFIYLLVILMSILILSDTGLKAYGGVDKDLLDKSVPVKSSKVSDTKPGSIKIPVSVKKDEIYDNIQITASVEPNIVPKNGTFTLKITLVTTWKSSGFTAAKILTPKFSWARNISSFSRNTYSSSKGKIVFINQQTFKYRVNTEGEFTIPPIPATVKDPNTGKSYTVRTNPLLIKVVKSSKTIQKPKDPYTRKPSRMPNICLYVIIILILLIMVIVLLIILKVSKRRGVSTATIKQPLNDKGYYLLQLDELFKKIPEDEDGRFTDEVDGLIKKWISFTFNVETEDYSTKEIIQKLESSEAEAELIESLGNFFDIVDKVKYANQDLDTTEREDFYQLARNIINMGS